ncbi:MAG: COX15/CtaA family protein [Arenicellales bacterium]
MLIHKRLQVAMWLCVCAFLVFCMVILGGAVRLTGSGLSMVDWQPIIGVVPPLSESGWLEAFDQYKQYPEYELVNRGMSLAEFKFIFYMEYVHRILGRLIGMVFIIPFLVFLYKGGLTSGLKYRLWLLLLLGAGQGLMGWFMVKSGLVSDPHVSQYRLTAHLLLAVVIFALLIRLICGLVYHDRDNDSSFGNNLIFNGRELSLGVLLLTFLMIGTGGLMAGTHAGYIYNSWPKMGQEWVPDMAWAMIPWWLNIFENPLTIQLIHRWLAMVVAISVVFVGLKVIRHDTRARVRQFAGLAILVVVFQVILGVSTLLGGVPIALGVAHQGTALFLVGLIVAVWSEYLPRIAHGRSI